MEETKKEKAKRILGAIWRFIVFLVSFGQAYKDSKK